MAEALAQAAAHGDWIGKYLLPAEKAAGGIGKKGSKSMKELLDEIRADKKLSTAAHWEDGNKIRDGIIVRAGEEMVKYGSQWTVSEDQLEEKTAEMINATSTSNAFITPTTMTDLPQSGTLALHRTPRRSSNSTSTSCTASTAPSSSPRSSRDPGSAHTTRSGFWNGRAVSISQCTLPADHPNP